MFKIKDNQHRLAKILPRRAARRFEAGTSAAGGLSGHGSRSFLARIVACLLGAALLLNAPGCVQAGQSVFHEESKVHIVATLFPQYDFARIVGGDRVEVHMLLKPGTESHAYDPTPADILTVNGSDLFIYTGEEMESWAHTIVASLENDQVRVLDLSQGISLTPMAEVEAEHDHTHEAAAGGAQGAEHDHAHTFEPHIWTDPIYAKVMVEKICQALCQLDPDSAAYYTANAQAYLLELDELDASFRDIVSRARRTQIVHAGRFALYYFAREYGLTYEAAFDSCSSETEPNARAVAHIIDLIRQEDIPVIYYEEMASPRVAQQIAEETGAKALLLHSCHNVSKQELDAGVTYLSLMRQNAINLEMGLC